MVRKILAVGLLAAGLVVAIEGTLAEIEARTVREPIFETGVIVGTALIVAIVLALGSYLLWPKSN